MVALGHIPSLPPLEDAEHLVESEAEALAERRVRREIKGVGNRRPRCEACCKFLRSNAQACSCGYLNGRGFAA